MLDPTNRARLGSHVSARVRSGGCLRSPCAPVYVSMKWFQFVTSLFCDCFTDIWIIAIERTIYWSFRFTGHCCSNDDVIWLDVQIYEFCIVLLGSFPPSLIDSCLPITVAMCIMCHMFDQQGKLRDAKSSNDRCKTARVCFWYDFGFVSVAVQNPCSVVVFSVMKCELQYVFL